MQFQHSQRSVEDTTGSSCPWPGFHSDTIIRMDAEETAFPALDALDDLPQPKSLAMWDVDPEVMVQHKATVLLKTFWAEHAPAGELYEPEKAAALLLANVKPKRDTISRI